MTVVAGGAGTGSVDLFWVYCPRAP